MREWHTPFYGDQDLDYPDFEVKDQVWNRLLELRAMKIQKELEVKKQHRLFTTFKQKLEALQADCDSIDEQVTRFMRGPPSLAGSIQAFPLPPPEINGHR